MKPQYRIYFVIVFLALVAVAYFIRSSYNQKKTEFYLSLEHSAKLLEQEMITRLAKVELGLKNASRLAAKFGLTNKDFVRSDLYFLRQDLHEIENVELTLIDVNGQMTFTTLTWASAMAQEAGDIRFSEQTWFKNLKSGLDERLQVSPPTKNLFLDELVVFCSKVIRDERGKFIGVITATIPASYFHEFAATFVPTSSSTIAITTGNPPQFVARYPTVAKQIETELTAHQKQVYQSPEYLLIEERVSTFDKVMRVFARIKIADYDMTITVGQAKSDYFSDWKSTSLWIITLFAIGAIIGFIAIQRQVNNSEALEMQRAKLQSTANLASLGEMAGGIAHEINNPLAIIVAKTEMLLRIVQNESVVKSENQKYLLLGLDKILQTSNRIGNIVRSMRAVARPADHDPFVQENIKAILSDTINLCNEKFRANGVLLDCESILDSSNNKNFLVNCRPTQLVQIFLNLFNNSFDAIEELSEKWIRVEAQMLQKNTFSISVTDSGSGIPIDIQEKLMQPFFTTKAIGKGSGLGLSISRKIIESHGGRIYIDSECVNTRFVIELPLVQVDKNLISNKKK